MFCCPNCKKPLPKCYICLGSLGLVNPQAEIKAHLARKTVATAIPSASSASPTPSSHPPPPISLSLLETTDEDVGGSDLPNPGGGGGQNTELQHQNFLSQGRWVMWCQHCKHGGHASCIDLWFQSHGVCGVNGCHCTCMLRPAPAPNGPSSLV
jgi:hypothetical protein